MGDLDKAKRIADLAFGEADFGTVVDAIHGAIFAERQRCAEAVTRLKGGQYIDRGAAQSAILNP